jgi:putative transposase
MTGNKFVKILTIQNAPKSYQCEKYICTRCRRAFVLGENGFSKVSSDPKMITEALNLAFSNMSYRAIVRHLKITYGVSLSHVAIKKWIDKYTSVISSYVNTLKPELGDVWHVDEIMLNIKKTEPTGKGFYSWCWNTLDGSSRFVLASELSKRREISDASNAFAKGKENANGALPSYVVTDCLNSYKKAFIKEFNDRAVIHVRTKSLSEGFENRPVERCHNELRSVIEARRGLGNDESAQKFVDCYRHYHNFVRPHTGLPNNQTPAEAAGIDLKLDPQNPMKDLIVKSATESLKEKSPEMYVINQLGKRFEKLTVDNEKDCVKFKQKAWIEREVWREINDILRVNGFSWLSNGKDSCWIRMQN